MITATCPTSEDQQLVPVVRLDELPPGTMISIEVGGRHVTLLRHRGRPEARAGGPEARAGGPDPLAGRPDPLAGRPDPLAGGPEARAGGPDDDGLYAIAAFCTHAAGPLGEGILTSDLCIVCPWHGATFDARSGQVLRGPARKSLRTYRTFVEDGTVFIAL